MLVKDIIQENEKNRISSRLENRKIALFFSLLDLDMGFRVEYSSCLRVNK